MIIRLLIISIISFWLVPPCAGERYGGEFLNIPVGSRAQALGGAYGPVADDASAVYWNPAALSSLSRFELMLCHTSLFKDLAQHDYLGVVGPMRPNLWVGLAWIRLGIDGIPRFSHTVGTPPEGEFSDNENALLAGAATKRRFRALGRSVCVQAGGSIKVIYDRLDDSQATGVGLDAGLLASFRLAELLRPTAGGGIEEVLISARYPYLGAAYLSAVFSDIGGTSISWDTPRQHRDVRPGSARVGAAYRQPLAFMRSSLLLSWETSTEPLQKGRAGCELELHRRLFLRAGIDDRKAVWGGGAEVWRLRLDYAFNGHDLGNTHRVSVAIKL